MRRVMASVLAAATIGLAATVAAPASAAPPNCNQQTGLGNTVLKSWIPTYNGNRDCVMGSGNVSDGVKALQNSLRYCYHQAITVDRVFGAQTRSALITVQRQIGVPADGVYGPVTGARMDWTYVGAFPGCQRVG